MAENEIQIIVEVDDRATAKFDAIDASAQRIGASIEQSMQKFMDMAGNATQYATEKFNHFGKDSIGTMRSFARAAEEATKDVRKSFKTIGDGTDGKTLTNAMQGTAVALTAVGTSAAQAGTQMAGAAASGASLAASGTVATGGLNLAATAALAAAAAVPAATAAFLALGPALLAVGGLAGGAITGLLGTGIAVGTLGVGLGGVTDAWNAYGKAAGGGGGASKGAGEQAYQAARRIEMAEDSLAKARRRQREASEDVNEAREEERERIEDLVLALRAQKFAQEDATDALRSAEEKLTREKAYGNSTSQDAAQKEVDRAKYRYDYETERLDDLKKEKADADRKGIEGSDQVKAALDRERDAAEAVTAAQKALADAKRKTEIASGGAAGGINAFDEAMSKLAPNAQKFVRKLIELKERFADIKREVQDRLFAGLDETLEKMADVWGPKLVPLLGGMADALNKVAKGLGDSFSDPEFVDNVMKIGEHFERFLETLGESAGRLIDAFGRIGAASGPVLDKIGDLIFKISDGFADWIEKADETGDLDQFMQDAADTLDRLFRIGEKVWGIMGKIVEILFPESKSAGDSFLVGVEKSLGEIESWLGDPENQQMIRDMITDFKNFFHKLVDEYIPDLVEFGKKFGEIATPIAKVIKKFVDVQYWLTVTLPAAINGFAKKGGNIFNGVKEGFRTALNWIIGKWNAIEFTMPTVSMFGQTFGGGSFGTPNIDYLATGGITGAGRVIMNERGPEAVKLPQGSMVYSAGDSARMMGGGGPGRDVNLRVKADRTTERGIVDAVLGMLRFEIETQYGGDVQRALGSSR